MNGSMKNGSTNGSHRNGSANGSRRNGSLKNGSATHDEEKPLLSRKRVAEAIAEQPWPKKPRISRRPMSQPSPKILIPAANQLHQGLPDLPPPESPLDAATNGLTFFEKLQLDPGEWGCEYGGPMFLLPGIVITWYVTKTPISTFHATEIKNYLFARADPELGGWGLHTEGESTAFGCTLSYTALRLLGVDAEDPIMVKARARLHQLGGATSSPHWAKWWLAVLGVASWDLVNPVPPELWLGPGLGADRSLEVVDPYPPGLLAHVQHASINWKARRNDIATTDNYHPKTWVLNTVNWLLVNIWEPYLKTSAIWRRPKRGSVKLVDMEDANTDYAGLAPVKQSHEMRLCATFAMGPVRTLFDDTRNVFHDALWMNAEGMLCNGTNGVQSWDTAFTIQAIMAAGLEKDERWRPMLNKALGFLDRQQIRENCKDQEKCYRQHRKGGWPFSNRDQGYIVSDCVSECIKSVIMLQKSEGYPQLLDDQRIFDAIDAILLFQNDTGGVGTYENRRGGKYMEYLNAAEVFGNIMVEYDYPECTTACLTALSLFREYWPEYRAEEIKVFCDRAVKWITSNQTAEGGWYGSWGICFTYAAMFALESLAGVGDVYETSAPSRKGCDFLVGKQRFDGGWSESYKACETMKWVEHPSGSLVVQTAWAALALMEAEYPDVGPIKRAIRFIMSRQQTNGEWLAESIEGVFNKSCMITYPNYKFTFPIKALGLFAKKYPDEVINLEEED
ncbi:lanosterol synthase [Verticillium alfalfae VaMs.102]|uniref:Terpene cyclase/mutase family member n=1 Tax=Verticillium alfalfae (strain VaMs.102 / ATCC MYA-4576 / FGSC 10136) TaxID=526221 RepID=C9SRW4_VERA1|nr:lanosterol synthase [Verticillium alfalfae VaMs.102]EEY21529.1 lanosterol synthase [Verticillium alfalfae VaMs.102]